MTLQPGDRVRITGTMPNDPDPLPVGATGTVARVLHSAQQADVAWDNGRTLLLLLDVDPYQVIGRAPLPEPTCDGMADLPTYARKASNGLHPHAGDRQAGQVRQPTTSYQMVWREPARDEFGAPTGKLKQISETFPTERKAKAHLRKVETDLDTAAGVSPSTAKAKADTPMGTYAKQYLDGLVGSIDPNTIEGYEKVYCAHIGPVFGRTPVAAIITADVARFRAVLLATACPPSRQGQSHILPRPGCSYRGSQP